MRLAGTVGTTPLCVGPLEVQPLLQPLLDPKSNNAPVLNRAGTALLSLHAATLTLKQVL